MTDLFAPCMQLTGRDGNATLLLVCIIVRMPEAKAQHNGYSWIARLALEWCAETGLSEKQYHRKIKKLRQLGLVKTQQHLFGENVTHLRLEGAALELVPAQAQPGTKAQANPVLPAAGKAVLTGTGIPEFENSPKAGHPSSSGSGEPTPPALRDPMIPGIGNPAGEKLGNKWQKSAHAKKTAAKPGAKPFGHGWLPAAASGQSQSPASGNSPRIGNTTSRESRNWGTLKAARSWPVVSASLPKAGIPELGIP